MMDGVTNDDDLPWAVCKDPRFIDIPEVGSMVYIEFENGNIYKPIYSGYICGPDKKTVPSEALADYPDTKVLKFPNGAILQFDKDGSITIKGTTVFINAKQINLGEKPLGYVVLCPSPNQTIVTDSGSLISSGKILGG